MIAFGAHGGASAVEIMAVQDDGKLSKMVLSKFFNSL